MAVKEILERKAKVLIGLRKYKLIKTEEEKEGLLYLVEAPEGKKLVMWAVPSTEAIGIRYLNLLPKMIKANEADGGIIISSGRYTQSAKSTARKRGIELISEDFPSFNIFEHYLVPRHEILSAEEKAEALQKYRVEAYQLPRIKTSDPVIRVIGAKPGDLIKITRKSPSAGEYVSYRYVVEG